MTPVEQRVTELLQETAPPSIGVSFEAVAQRARRRRAARLSVLASAAAVIVTVAGVAVALSQRDGNGSQLATRPTAPARQASDNLVALTRHVQCPQPSTAIPVNQLTAFHAVTAVTCSQTTRDLPGQGQWLVEVRRAAITGVPALQAAFERPNEPVRAGVHCPATLALTAPPPLVLVDNAGRTLSPTEPLDGCGQPQPQFTAALRGVTWEDVAVRKVRQTQTPQAQAVGCPQQFKNMTYVDAGSGTSAGGPLFSRTPTSVHLCLYRVTGSDLEVGEFQRGFAASAGDTARLLTALSRPGVSGSCTPQRAFAVVLTGNSWATVEIGGCWRVARSYPNSDLGSADAAAVKAVLQGR